LNETSACLAEYGDEVKGSLHSGLTAGEIEVCYEEEKRTTEMAQVVALQVLTLTDMLSDFHLVNVSIGPHADLILLLLEKTPGNTSKDGGRQIRHARKAARSPHHFRIFHQIGPEHFESIDLPLVQEDFFFAQPLSSHIWLLMRTRTGFLGDHNTSVYSCEGSLLNSFHAGDAIQDVQVDEASAIWVSFFDEGVFGDEQPGPAGLVCFNEKGQVLFKYNELAERVGAPEIADCYAMNVCSHREVWLYPYTDFPLVQLVEKQIAHVWLNIPVRGSSAFATDGKRALFAGAYKDRQTLFLITLSPMSVEKLVVTDEEGTPLSFHSACGRGSRLYLVTDRAIFVLDLEML
jgi:hypothetical protein